MTTRLTRKYWIQQSGPYNPRDLPDGMAYDVRRTEVFIRDVDRVKVYLEEGQAYVFEVRGMDSGGGTHPDPELRGVYVDPNDPNDPVDLGRPWPYGTYLGNARLLWGFWVPSDVHFDDFRTLYKGRIYSNGISEVDDDYDDLPTGPKDDPSREVVVDTYDDDEEEQTGTTLSIPDLNGMTRDHAYDLDDGIGQDAWMLFRPLADGDYFLQIEGSGNFFGEEGTYTVLVYEADMVDDDTEIMYEIGADGSCEVINESLTIEAVEKSVYEGTDAKFLIRGPGELDGESVELNYSYEGYDDYFASSSPLAGPHSVQLTDDPLQPDGQWEVTVETDYDPMVEEKPGSVTIAIKPNGLYTVGDPASATVYVVDKDGAPFITSTEANLHSELPLWEAVVSWELHKDVDDSEVTLWDVDYSRGSSSRRDTPKYWIGPGYTAPNPHDTSFEWFASDDSIHFRVRALFKGGVYGPWSETKCQEAPEEVAQPQATVSLEFLSSGDHVLEPPLGQGHVVPARHRVPPGGGH